MAKIEIKSSWDGDTTTWRVYVDGHMESAHWDYESAKESADELETKLNNGMSNKEDKVMKNATVNTNGKVEVIEIEVDGVKYVQTRPNYYYKNVNGKQTRIAKVEWDMAWEKSGMAEKMAKEAEEAKAKPAKAKKARKSKDIALEVDGVTITKKQADFIQLMPEDDFYEHGLDSALWIDYFCDTISGKFNPMAVGAMVSTLREKGILSVGMQKVNGKNSKFIAFTDLGKKIAKELGLE